MNEPTLFERLRRPIRRHHRLLRMTALVLVAVALLRATGLLETGGLAIYDRYNRFLAAPGHSEQLLVIGFEEADFANYPSYPFTDELLATLLRKLAEHDPAALIVSVLRDIPVEPGHQELLQVYRELPMIYGTSVSRAGVRDDVLPPPIIRDTQRHGPMPTLNDGDGVIRRHVFGYRDEQGREDALAVRVVRDLLQPQGIEVGFDEQDRLILGKRRYPPMGHAFGEYRGAAGFAGDLSFMLPYRQNESVGMISFTRALSGDYDPELVRGRIVLIGPTAQSIRVGVNTPLNPQERGVISTIQNLAWQIDNLHAVATGQWPILASPSLWQQWLLLALLALLCCRGFLHDSGIGWALTRGALTMLAIVLGGLLAFWLGYWLPVSAMLATVFAAGLVSVDNVIRAESTQRRLLDFTRTVFDRLPDPVFVIDDNNRLSMVNEAFSRLVASAPEALDGRSTRDLIEPEGQATTSPSSTDPAALRTWRLRALSGERYALQVRESVIRDQRGRRLRLGMVQSASRITDNAGAEPLPSAADILQYRYEAAAQWARQGRSQPWLLHVGIADPELLGEACGEALVKQFLEALAERLRGAFPDADAVLCDTDSVIILLVRGESGPQEEALHKRVRQALTWPLPVDEQTSDADLNLGIARYGRDGNDLQELRTSARAQARELAITQR